MDTTYQQKAKDFCTKHNIEITITFARYGEHFVDDKERRDIYEVRIKSPQGEMRFEFGQSILKTGVPPTEYDVLVVLEKDGARDFEEFCAEYVYDSDSIEAKALWERWLQEALDVQRVFSHCLDELQEIC